MEMVFLTQLARMGTRDRIVPTSISLMRPPENEAAYTAFLGIRIILGQQNCITFSALDARRPFLTENSGMWQSFEPGLRKRLADLDQDASMTERVRSTLLDMLPAGQSQIDQAADRLSISKRSLQRRLGAEGASFQTVLQSTRTELAEHYLGNSELPTGEISFLLGFRDTNSFIRAFSGWTGQTPGQFRSHH